MNACMHLYPQRKCLPFAVYMPDIIIELKSAGPLETSTTASTE